MKFKKIKQIIRAEYLTIFESFSGYNVLRKENWQILNPNKPTEYDDFEVGMISGKGDCKLFVYLKHKENKE